MIFETQRLILKPILESELNTLHKIFADSHIRKYLCDDKIFSWQQIKEMLQHNQKYFEEERFGLWWIREKEEDEILGFVGLWRFFDEKQPQLIYALLPKALNQGYATEAARKIIKYCFDQLGYKYVVASCDRPNLESQKVMKRLGMKQMTEKNIEGKAVLFFRLENRQ